MNDMAKLRVTRVLVLLGAVLVSATASALQVECNAGNELRVSSAFDIGPHVRVAESERLRFTLSTQVVSHDRDHWIEVELVELPSERVIFRNAWKSNREALESRHRLESFGWATLYTARFPEGMVVSCALDQ